MNIDHTNMLQEVRASKTGQVSSVGRALIHCSVACVLALTVAGASAQDRGFRRDDQPPQQQQQRDDRDRGERSAQRQDVPRFEPRDTRIDDARRAQQERSAEVQRHSGRMTPDEKRDLRRQINEAGVDLYPNTPRR